MRHEPGSPESWLAYAKSDLALARHADDQRVLLESLCFHAQQAAEKAVKAVLIRCGVPATKTHSIERLVDMLPPSVERIPLLVEAAQLSEYAVTFRYPGDEAPVSVDEYEDALRLTEAVVLWAEGLL